jgi:enoyl-CoA hydratase / long-chain 3-hydroxyacyl-CoA dehydrogenase
MKDRDAAAVARGTAQVADSLAARLKKRQLTPFERDLTLSRIAGVSDADAAWPKHLGRCDVVIEAVPEVLALKHAVIQQIEPLLRESAVIATNTSALPIASIAAAAARPGRVLGMHYFSPVDRMPLLEVIPHAGTAPDALAAAFDLGLRQGKTVIVVKDVPGFYVNRSLAPWADEALLLVQGGMAPDVLDAAVRAFGYPVGPVALADEVGVDVLFHTASTIGPSLGPHRMAGAAGSAPWLKAMVDAKLLGKKTGRGFYVHDSGSSSGKKGKGGGGPLAAVTALLSGGGGGSSKSRGKPVNPEALALLAPYRTAAEAATAPAAAVERMVLRFVKECIHSLEDGVIRSPGDGDVGAVFGLGFPPFLGGPFRYADALGAAALADTMRAYADALGPRFAPPQALLDLAKSGGSFHGGGKRA